MPGKNIQAFGLLFHLITVILISIMDGQKKKILLVEDDDTLAEVYRQSASGGGKYERYHSA